jgi:YgiT-type zinc finger domain-containing protein
MATDPQESAWRCARCDEKLVVKKVVFTYLGHSIAHEVPACPKCGKVFISIELAEGRMCEAEHTLEDK